MGTARALVAGSGFWPEWSARVSGRNVAGSSSAMSVVLLIVLGRLVDRCCEARAVEGRSDRRSRVVWLEGNKKAAAPPGTAAPGPRLWSRFLRQVVRDLRPHPPHGGAASTYTCLGSAGWQSRSGHGRAGE